jgi:hypothetical protein
MVVSLSGVLSDEKTGLPFVSCQSQLHCNFVLPCLNSMSHTLQVYIYTRHYFYNMYKNSLSVQALNSRVCLIVSSSRYNGNFVNWTVVCLTAAKFKPLIFFFAGPRVVQCWIHSHFHDFVWGWLSTDYTALYPRRQCPSYFQDVTSQNMTLCCVFSGCDLINI